MYVGRGKFKRLYVPHIRTDYVITQTECTRCVKTKVTSANLIYLIYFFSHIDSVIIFKRSFGFWFDRLMSKWQLKTRSDRYAPRNINLSITYQMLSYSKVSR